MMTAGRRSPPTPASPGAAPAPPAAAAAPSAAMGLLMPELRGEPPGESGDMEIGDVCEMGDMSALRGVHDPAGASDVLELPVGREKSEAVGVGSVVMGATAWSNACSGEMVTDKVVFRVK